MSLLKKFVTRSIHLKAHVMKLLGEVLYKKYTQVLRVSLCDVYLLELISLI